MAKGIEREEVRPVMGVLRRIAAQMRRGGDDVELAPAVRERLEGMDLTAEQIELVRGMARRLAHRQQ